MRKSGSLTTSRKPCGWMLPEIWMGSSAHRLIGSSRAWASVVLIVCVLVLVSSGPEVTGRHQCKLLPNVGDYAVDRAESVGNANSRAYCSVRHFNPTELARQSGGLYKRSLALGHYDRRGGWKRASNSC